MIESLKRVLARSDSADLVNVRSQLGGHAEMGQGVQPQPRDRLPPQAGPIAAGGAGTRRTATAGQAPQGAVSVLGGAAPAPSEARLPATGSGEAGVAREASQGGASSPAPQAKQLWARSDHSGAAPAAGSRACAAPPEPAVRRVLEAAGREGASRRPGEASSLATPGEAALAAGPQARSGGWSSCRASTRQHRFDSSKHPQSASYHQYGAGSERTIKRNRYGLQRTRVHGRGQPPCSG